jgi:hypothetical protein
VISQCVGQNVFHTNFVVLILPILADLLYLQMFYPHILLLEFRLCRDDGGEADMLICLTNMVPTFNLALPSFRSHIESSC